MPIQPYTIMCISLCLFAQPTWATEKPSLLSETSRFSWDNDFYFFRDAQISNIFSYQRHAAASPSTHDATLYQRSSWGFQQTMQTPQKSTPIDKAALDAPFVGTFIIQKSWYDFNDQQLQGYAISGGVVGALSLAEQTQELVHRLRGVQVYQGWSEQLPSEPLINAHALYKTKLYQSSGILSWDVSLGGNIALGNMITQASSDVELRFGYNMPLGFSYIPNTFGFNMHYLANTKPTLEHDVSLYASVVLRTSAIAYNIYLDGSLFQHAPNTSKNNLIGLLVAGIHFETPSYGIHFNILASSNNINTNIARYAIGNERIGAFTYDWRY